MNREIVEARVVAALMEELLANVAFSQVDAAHAADLGRFCSQGIDRHADPEARAALGEQGLSSLSTRLAEDLMAMRGFFALLQTDDVSDVLVNGPSKVYVERAGRLAPTGVVFPSEEALARVALWMTARVGRPVSPERPMVDARLPDGSRLNVIVPPLALDGTVLSIRRFRHAGLDLPGLATGGTFPAPLEQLLRAMVACRLNVLVSGGTGAGKTTFLNALSEAIGEGERVVTIEDSAELRLRQEHVVRLETRVSDAAGQGEVTTRALVRNALRMRPDRILVGEVRGPEAVDMLQAMNTGHEGSMSTIHANGPRDALARLEVMAGMSELGLDEQVIRSQVARSLDALIHVRRLPDGGRVIDSVVEVTGLQGPVIATQDLLRFEHRGEGPDGRSRGGWRSTGVRPAFADRLVGRGHELPAGLWRLAIDRS
jgi:pilus assembly protein CpaF